MTTPNARLDARFSDPSAGPTAWADAERVLVEAELYWLTTVRADGRPHVTPLIGVHHEGALHFCTGLREQKHRNLDANPRVALTTGANAWAAGLDVVVEGTVAAVRATADLQALADAYVAKYGEVWRFEVGDGVFGSGDDAATVFRVAADKVIAFAKDPHAQTTFRLGAG
jgi:general stress protein 26